MNLVIPDTLDGYTVTEIADNVFSNCDTLLTVTFPDTLKHIGNDAFSNCKKLKSPNLPLGLLTIGDRAFSNITFFYINLPRTLTFIGEDAFKGISFINTYKGTYSNNWANNFFAIYPDVTSIGFYYTHIYINNRSKKDIILFENDVVSLNTYLSNDDEENISDYIWQYSYDCINWIDIDTDAFYDYTFYAKDYVQKTFFRVKVIDITGVYYSNIVSCVCLEDGFKILEPFVNGTSVYFDWNYDYYGLTYTLYMKENDYDYIVLTENANEQFIDISDLNPNTQYTFKFEAKMNDNNAFSEEIVIKTEEKNEKNHALLIAEAYNYGEFITLPDAIGDIRLMSNMLNTLNTPQNINFQYVRKVDVSSEQIHQAILDTFKDTKEDDISLFYITSHGNMSEDNAGSILTFDKELSDIELLSLDTLSEWLSAIPGKKIIFLEFCSSGSALYESDQYKAPFKKDNFFVIVSSDHLEESYICDDTDNPISQYTVALFNALGNGENFNCDKNNDGLATTNEILSYIDAYIKNNYYNYQHVSAYSFLDDYKVFASKLYFQIKKQKEFEESISVEGYTGDYDGDEHCIKVTAPEGSEIKYGLTEDCIQLTNNPSFREPGSNTVFYEVSKPELKPVSGSAIVFINQPAQNNNDNIVIDHDYYAESINTNSGSNNYNNAGNVGSDTDKYDDQPITADRIAKFIEKYPNISKCVSESLEYLFTSKNITKLILQFRTYFTVKTILNSLAKTINDYGN